MIEMTDTEAANILRSIVKDVKTGEEERPGGTISSASYLITVGSLKQIEDIAEWLDWYQRENRERILLTRKWLEARSGYEQI